MDTISSKGSPGQEDRPNRNNNLITTEKIKMLDITRDKPIKVAVKVAVPVRDHPKFNFVGKLLGPKGNSMKRLQEDTMCKMAVLGRGSMKDRKKEEELRASGEPRYAHLSEDLHVEISTFAAPAEAHARIAYALAEVRRFLVPDYHDDIRQEQMWEMQALSTTSSISQTGEQNSPNSVIGDGETDIIEDKTHINTQNPNMNMDCENEMTSAATIPLTICTTSTTSTLASPTNNNNLSNPRSIHPSAVTATIHHQLASAAAAVAASGMGIIKPATGVAAVTGITPSQTTLGMPAEAEVTAPALALLEPPGALLHPALRGVKAVNIAGCSLARKRPLLGVSRTTSMNPTKRTVMTLLARVKNSQAIHAARSQGTASSITEPLQMITSPLILPQVMETAMITAKKESLSQGV